MHGDHFDPAAEDSAWLPVVASRGWIILSKDQFNWLERRAIINAKGRAFCSDKEVYPARRKFR
jgi:hypothetical protein